MISTLPIASAILAVKLFLGLALGFQGLIEFSDVGVILTAGVFLTGFLLAGTMADYKEAERLPGRELLALTDAIKNWLMKRRTTDEEEPDHTRRAASRSC